MNTYTTSVESSYGIAQQLKNSPKLIYDARDETLISKLDNLKITYGKLINCYTKHMQLQDKLKVVLIQYMSENVYYVNLVCEGFSLAIKFNDYSLPDCYILDTDSTPLKQGFGNITKNLDRYIANFYQDLKDVNNHLQSEKHHD